MTMTVDVYTQIIWQQHVRTWPVEVTLSSHAGPVQVRRLKPF